MPISLANYSQRQFQRKAQQVFRKLFKKATPEINRQAIGILLGGQPASGKTNLIDTIKRNTPDRQFVVINGDEFRAFHPNYKAISDQYGTEAPHYTQPFSNAMVEWAKNECLTKGYNFIVEGTMRNFSVIQNTVAELQAHGFRAELLANELAICIDTAEMTNLDTVDFDRLFAQVRQPQRDATFYAHQYETLRQSAQNRGETNAPYLAQLTALKDQLS